MGLWLSFRALVAISVTLAVLLAALAVVQYRWSGRVAAADAQREREYLESSMALFAGEANQALGNAAQYLQLVAGGTRAGNTVFPPPLLLRELYFVEFPSDADPRWKRLSASGEFQAVTAPVDLQGTRCGFFTNFDNLTLVTPVFEFETRNRGSAGRGSIQRTVRVREPRCFVARLDADYLRDALFPELLRKSFGEMTMQEYDFAIVARREPSMQATAKPLLGEAVTPDLRKTFFVLPPESLLPGGVPRPSAQPGRDMVFIRRMEIDANGNPGDAFADGMFELQVAHKGIPLAQAVERVRMRDLLVSIGVEAMLGAAIVLLLVGVRRMQVLADQKVRFVAGVSHELRTPVSAIAMLSRNQADGLVDSPEKVRQYGELIHQQSRRLNEMVEQTLQLAGAHSGLRRREDQEVDMRALLESCLEARRDEFTREGFCVELYAEPALPAVRGDARLLRTAIDNLLSNVLKYARSGKWVRVSASAEASPKRLRIVVEDRGDGIDPADQKEIFEPFYRGRGAIEQQIPGSGLGLSLVRSAMDAHRGSVTVESRAGQGTTFTLELPL
jgi:signal transduction histidine kinase